MYWVANKLKKLKLDLKSWSKGTFGDFKHKLERNAKKPLQVKGKLISQPNNARLNNWHYQLVKHHEKLHLLNQKYWGKMVRKELLVYSDRNSRYFHHVIKARKSRSKIINIKDSSSVWVDDLAQLQYLFVNEFKVWFKSSHACIGSFELIYQRRSPRGIMTSLWDQFKTKKLKMKFFEWTRLKLFALTVLEQLFIKNTGT